MTLNVQMKQIVSFVKKSDKIGCVRGLNLTVLLWSLLACSFGFLASVVIFCYKHDSVGEMQLAAARTVEMSLVFAVKASLPISGYITSNCKISTVGIWKSPSQPLSIM